MTLSTTTNKASYAGDGATTAFAIPFLFLENGHIEAVLRDAAGTEAIWTLNTEYTLSGAGTAAGGTLTVIVSPDDHTPAAGETLVIRRVAPETQETDYPEGGAFPAAAHEQALDKLTMLVQQQSEEIARSLRLPVSSALTDIRVPEPGAGGVLRWNAAGTGVETAGLADLGLVVPAEVTAPAAGDLLVHDGTLWANRAPGILDVRDFGAVGDGIADDTAALQAAIDAGSGTAPVFLPAGTYRITAALDARAGDLKLVGAGPNRTVIRQHADNVACLAIGGGGNHVADIGLHYDQPQPIGNTGANCIEFHACAWSVFERLSMYRCNRGLYVAQVAVNEGANWVFSTSFRDIAVSYYSNSGVDLSGYNGGISGNVMSNIYLAGRDDLGNALETGAALSLGAWSNGVLSQINVEGSKPYEAMFFNTCTGLVLNGLHFESLEFASNYTSLMHFTGGSHTVTNLDVNFCTISATNLVAIVRASVPNTKVGVSGVKEAFNTIMAPQWYMFSVGNDETGVDLWADSVQASGLNGVGFTTSVPSPIRRFNGVTYHENLGGKRRLLANAAPTTGTWAVGDEMKNSAPSVSGIAGWICTEGGTPGVWQPVYLSAGTRTVPIVSTDWRQAAAMKSDLPDLPDGIDTLGLGGAPEAVLAGTTTNGSATPSAEERAAVLFVLPDNYVAASPLTFRVAASVSVQRNASQIIKLIGRLRTADGSLGADICTTGPQSLTAALADYDFSIAPASLERGDILYLEVTLSTDDTGGASDGFPMITGASLLVPVNS